jgi:zinc transporter 1/2/3
MATAFDPQNVNLTSADPAEVVCYLEMSGNDYNGHLGERISALFVILIVPTASTFFPVLATRVRRLRIPLYMYLFARYFGSGVIIATAFIHLLDPAYGEIGPNTCVGMTGNWAGYSWPPAIAMSSVMMIFLLDFLAKYYVERKYGTPHGGSVKRPEIEDIITDGDKANGGPGPAPVLDAHGPHQYLHSADLNPKPAAHLSQDNTAIAHIERGNQGQNSLKLAELAQPLGDSKATDQAFKQQIASFLILESGIIIHSVIIGLNLGVVGQEFFVLYPVLIFHQTFEGLGVGARLSVIPFPSHLRWMPWMLCAAYGLTTPIAIGIGLGLRNTYNGNSNTANIVSGVLYSATAGILIYTGLVDMLARDFLFNPSQTQDKKLLALMLVSLYAGAGIMALIGKWA